MDDTSAAAIGRLETQMAVLARRIESAARRTSTYAEMDRASYLIARTLDENGAMSVNEIARRLNLDGSTVTRQLAVMDTRGFIERARLPEDRRASVINLAARGRTEMGRIIDVRRHRFQTMLADWSQTDLARFATLLARFNDSMAAAIAPNAEPAPHAAAPRRRAPEQHRRSVLPSAARRRS
jgi:DNA-binding MarR family transcriptional regulator